MNIPKLAAISVSLIALVLLVSCGSGTMGNEPTPGTSIPEDAMTSSEQEPTESAEPVYILNASLAKSPIPTPDDALMLFKAQIAASAAEQFVDKLSGLWEKIDGSTATIPLTAALYERLGDGAGAPKHNATSYAYSHLVECRSDLIFVTYPSEYQLESAQREGIELDIIPIAKDALVFLVNKTNPIDDIKLSHLRDIYLGNITNWEPLGGLNEEIVPYQRTLNSGSQTLLQKLVMEGQEPMYPPESWVISSMSGLVDVVSSYDNAREAIGYSMYYYVNNMYGNDQFKLLSVDGVKPSRETITRGEYPLEDFYYAVIRRDTPADSPARRLIEWLLSDDGQALAIQAGYIPMHPMDVVLLDDAFDPVYIGDVEFSSGTGGSEIKSWEDYDKAIANGTEMPLSDIFYDGFNYIQFINNEIASRLSYIQEDYTKRSFAGIPNDYPNYELVQDEKRVILNIHFPDPNPFFRFKETFGIKLTENISPYGKGFAKVIETGDYAGRVLPDASVYTYRITLPDSPDVTERINAHLLSWVDSFPDDENAARLVESYAEWWGHHVWLLPWTGQWRNYLAVSYVLLSDYWFRDWIDPPYFIYDRPLAYTICFDMETGDVVELADAITTALPFQNARVFEPTVVYEGSYEGSHKVSYEDSYVNASDNPNDYLADYSPPDGYTIDKAWILDSILCLCITEPGGRKLQVTIDEDLR